MSQEPLQYLPPERWSDLLTAFKEDWPRGMTGYTVLENRRQWKEKGFKYEFADVYCPFGEVKNGMVIINEKKNLYEVIIQCPSDDTENLETALRKTELVDWQRKIMVPYAPNNVIECLRKLLPILNMEIELIIPSEAFFLDRKTLYEDLDLPPNVTFDLVSYEHIDMIDSTWPHRYPTSTWYFQTLIDNKCGYGLFYDNSLVTWVFFNESGNLLHLYTVEEHRKKGYGELLLKLVCNIALKENRNAPAYCLKDNVNACKLYRKAGFFQSEEVAWVFLDKIK